jgi:hypothetical protein
MEGPTMPHNASAQFIGSFIVREFTRPTRGILDDFRTACVKPIGAWRTLTMANETREELIALMIASTAIETCLVCGELSAYAYGNCDAYDQFPDDIIPGGFRPLPGTIAHIGTASYWEWECGHCGAHHVDADSPILAPCYTHEDD